MNIIIADDEDLARSSLVSMLLELDLPVKIIGEASNGEELVKLCKTCHVDVAFADIKMPKMDGLMAIEALKDECNYTSWIILSGYSEFEYAKEAIKFGVVDYLLKPVSPNQLDSTLNSILRKNKEYLIGLNKEFEHDVIALFSNLISQSDLDMKSIINLSHFVK